MVLYFQTLSLKLPLSLLVLSLVFLTGCSTRGSKVYTKTTKLKPYDAKPKKMMLSVNSNSNYKITTLYKEFDKWNGVPYKLGGTSLNGVDCSSFIQQVYYDGFGLRIPRTTKQQLKIGYKVSQSELRVGDMIFFKTSWGVRHVGIIIVDGEFIHASTSKGVMISSIHNPYWRDVYFQSRRVLP